MEKGKARPAKGQERKSKVEGRKSSTALPGKVIKNIAKAIISIR
ncbi:hypothetical protein ACT3CE_17700 [Marinifilum sp. RC60d5]